VAVTQDLYELLGISRDATPEQIRKAYRQLARRMHPDVNGGDAESTERFKQINSAYEILSDPEKRARYDRFGSADGNPASADAGFSGFGGVQDIFDVFFGAGTREAQRGPERGSDLRYDLELTLEEVLAGVEKTISVTRHEPCGTCRGSGAREGTAPRPCVACSGTGVLRTARQTFFGTMSQVSDCYRCHGRGEMIDNPCGHCGGLGLERKTREIQVRIPAGAEERTRMRVAGQGETAPRGGTTGDLWVFLHIRPHPIFRRRGRDLVNEIEVSFPRAALGGMIEIPTLEGVERLNIPAGTQPGDVFRLRGKGLPEMNQPRLRGDQQVIIRVRTPTKLTDRQRKALEELADAGGEDLSRVDVPHRDRGFFERVRNLFGARADGHAEHEAHEEPDERASHR
jgi:molecular chaperone DnaJ